MTKILTPRFPDKRITKAPPEAVEFVRTGRAAKRRKQLQRQRDRESRTSFFLERIPRAYLAFDAAGKVVDWNTRAAAQFGWLGANRRRLGLNQLLERESANELRELLEAWSPETEGQRKELLAHHRSGHSFPIELVIARMQDGPEALYGALVEDISGRRRTEEIADLLSETSAALGSVDDVQEAAGRFLLTIMLRLSADFAAVWVLDPVSRRLRYAAGRAADEAGMVAFDRLSRRTVFAPGVGLPGRVIGTGSAVSVPDILNEDNFPRIGGALRAGLRSGFAVPVRRGGRVIGAVEVLSRSLLSCDEVQLRRFTALGDQVGLVIEGLTSRVRHNDA